MTAAPQQDVDVLSLILQAAAHAVETVAGGPIQIETAQMVPADRAVAAAGTMMNRSHLTAGGASGSLITVVPAGGLVTDAGIVDAGTLAGALADGVAAGIAAGGGPACRLSAPTLVASTVGLDLTGMEAVAFDLLAGARTASVVLIVEATLGSLLGGSIPVDEPAMGGPSVAPAQLPSLDRVGIVPANRPIETLKDVVTRFSVEIARGTVHVRDLVSMGPGSVFELDREAGDAVDVRVNGAIVARGDIVVIGKQLGVRITKIYEGER
jgi:flagellar motor switch protein FliN/FliY